MRYINKVPTHWEHPTPGWAWKMNQLQWVAQSRWSWSYPPWRRWSRKKRKIWIVLYCFLKFIYSEKATKFCEISTSLLSTVHTDKSKVEISQNFVSFSECMNFNCKSCPNYEVGFVKPKWNHWRYFELLVGFPPILSRDFVISALSG